MKRKILSLLAAMAAVSMMTVSAGATDGSSQDPGTVTVPKANDPYTNSEGKTDWASDSKPKYPFKKVFEINDSSNIPDADFTFTVTAGTKKDATDTTLAVLAGVEPENIVFRTVADNAHASFAEEGTTEITSSSGAITVHYAANEVTLGSGNAAAGSTLSKTDDNVVISDGNDGTYFAEKQVELDFSGCTFTEPGIYRYVIKETKGSKSGITYDEKYRIVDVYVDHSTTDSTETTNKLAITGCVMYSSETADIAGPSNKEAAGTDKVQQTMEDNTTVSADDLRSANAVKSVGFLNKYSTSKLTFEKKVSGNKASKDKYFEFTVKLRETETAKIADNDVFTLEGEWVNDGTAVANSATKYTADEINATGGSNKGNKVTKLTGAQLKAGYTFYLQDGQHVTITGIANGTAYTISEAQEDYTPSLTMKTDNMDSKNGEADVAIDEATKGLNQKATINDVSLEKDAWAVFTNTRQGTIPTGVIVSTAAPAGIGIAVIAGIIALAAKRRKEEE